MANKTNKTITQNPILQLLQDVDKNDNERSLKSLINSFDFLINNISEGIIVYNPDGQIKYVSKKHLEIIETNFKDALDFNFFEISDVRMKNAVKKSLHGETSHFSGSYLTKISNKMLYVDVVFQPIEYEEKIIGGIAIIKDLSNLEESNKKLKRSEEKFQNLVNNIPGTVYILSFDGNLKIEYISERVELITGITASQLLSGEKSMVDIVHPDDIHLVIDTIKKSAMTSEPFVNQFRIKLKNNEYNWVETYGSRIYEEGSGKITYQGIIININDRIEDRAKLEETESKLKCIIEQINLAICTLTEDFKIDVYNSNFKKFYQSFLNKEIISEEKFLQIDDKLALIDWHTGLESIERGESYNFVISNFENKIKYYEVLLNPIFREDKVNGAIIVVIDITEKVERENDLVKSKTAIDNSDSAIILSSVKGDILFINNKFSEMWQLQQSDVHLEHYSKLWYEEDIDKIINIRKKLEKTGRITSYNEVRGKRKDGSIFPVELKAKQILNEFEEPIAYTETIRDISDELEIKAELEENKSLFNEVIHSSPNIIFLVDESFSLSHYNDKFSKFFPNKKIGDNIDDIFSSKIESKKIISLVSDAFYGKTTNNIKIHFLSGNQEIECYSRIYPVRINSDKQNVVLANTFMGEIRESEQMLQESEEQFRFLFMSVSSVIITVDGLTHEILDCNKFAADTYGYSLEEMKNLHLKEIVSNYNIAKDTMNDIKKNQSVYLPVRYHIKKDGTVFPIEVSAGYYESKGVPIYYLVGRDISERKKYERDLEESKNELQKALQSKDRFFNIIAHDLKNPFFGFLELSKLLSKDLHKLSVKELSVSINELYSSSKNLFRLLENLLEWSRTQTGNITYNPEFYNLRQIIELSTDLFKNTLNSKDIKLEIDCDEKLQIICDAKITETIIRNLTSNAIKFSYAGGKIRIFVTEQENHISVSVEDNGIGIPEDAVGKLFVLDESFTTDGTENEKGTGLGLVLCQELVQIQNGTINVESKSNEGATFTFTIPKVKEAS